MLLPKTNRSIQVLRDTNKKEANGLSHKVKNLVMALSIHRRNNMRYFKQKKKKKQGSQ